MKVIAKNVGDFNNLTVGKEYDVITDKGHKVLVSDDKGKVVPLMPGFFDRIKDEFVVEHNDDLELSEDEMGIEDAY